MAAQLVRFHEAVKAVATLALVERSGAVRADRLIEGVSQADAEKAPAVARIQPTAIIKLDCMRFF